MTDCVGVRSFECLPPRLFCDAVDIGLLSEISFDFDFFRSLSLSRSLFLSFFLCLCLRCSSLSACDFFLDSFAVDVVVAAAAAADAEDAFPPATLLFDGIISICECVDGGGGTGGDGGRPSNTVRYLLLLSRDSFESFSYFLFEPLILSAALLRDFSSFDDLDECI